MKMMTLKTLITVVLANATYGHDTMRTETVYYRDARTHLKMRDSQKPKYYHKFSMFILIRNDILLGATKKVQKEKQIDIQKHSQIA